MVQITLSLSHTPSMQESGPFCQQVLHEIRKGFEEPENALTPYIIILESYASPEPGFLFSLGHFHIAFGQHFLDILSIPEIRNGLGVFLD